MKLSEFLFFIADRLNTFFYEIFCKKREVRNFEHNRKTELAKTGALHGSFIAKQRPLKDFRFGIKNLAYGGCGVVAIHNILVATRKEKGLPDLVLELEKHALVSGLFGISPHAVGEYLENEGFKVQKVFGRKSVKISEPCEKSVICFYFRRNLTAHFVAGISVGKGNHLFLNSHTGAYTEMTFSEYTESLFAFEKPLFVCLYTIRQQHG